MNQLKYLRPAGISSAIITFGEQLRARSLVASSRYLSNPFVIIVGKWTIPLGNSLSLIASGGITGYSGILKGIIHQAEDRCKVLLKNLFDVGWWNMEPSFVC